MHFAAIILGYLAATAIAAPAPNPNGFKEDCVKTTSHHATTTRRVGNVNPTSRKTTARTTTTTSRRTTTKSTTKSSTTSQSIAANSRTTTKSTTTKSTTTKSTTTASTTKLATITSIAATSKTTTTMSMTKLNTASSVAGSATASTSLFASVAQANCPSTYPTAQPAFDTIPTSCGVSWLTLLNEMRTAYKLPSLSWSAHLTQVAYGAAFNASGGAKPFVHSNLGYWDSFGEIESPGYVIPVGDLQGLTPFGAAIANWLCEVPTDPQVASLCTPIVKNLDHISEVAGETGHHDILVGGYTTVGCAFVFNTNTPTGVFAGIYVCDFGYGN